MQDRNRARRPRAGDSLPPGLTLCGPVFTRALAAEADVGWLSDSVLNSRWQIDRQGYGGFARRIAGIAFAPSRNDDVWRRGAVYLSFPRGSEQPDWPARPPQFELAPRMVVTPAAGA
jgi:hypothetical protein